MSTAGRSWGLARRYQVQLFFSCLIVQSVSRTRRQLGVPAHRPQRVLSLANVMDSGTASRSPRIAP